jgi:hypothetical protein
MIQAPNTPWPAVLLALAAIALPGGAPAAGEPAPEAWREIAVIGSPAAEAGSNFGGAVAVNQRRVLVGQRFATIDGNAMQGAAHLFSVAPTGDVIPGPTLLASNGALDDRYGSSVALRGDLAVVGAQRADVDGVEWQGVLYMYGPDGAGGWVENDAVVADDGLMFDELGTTLASDGVTVLGGAVQADGANVDQGAAYAYVFDGSGWQQQGKLVDPTGASFDAYATGIDVHDDIAVLGAPRATVDANFFQGKVQAWRRDAGDNWILEQAFSADDSAAFDAFGAAAALAPGAAGNPLQLLVGATSHDAGGIDNRGAVYVFERIAGPAWVQVQKLLAPDAVGGDQYGAAIAVSGDTAVVGAPLATGGAAQSGAVYVYRRDAGGSWSLEVTLAATAPQAQTDFGRAVAIDGDVIAVGADGATDQGLDEAGQVVLFARNLGLALPPPAVVPTLPRAGLVLLALLLAASAAVARRRRAQPCAASR